MASDVIDLTLKSGGSDDEECILSENLTFTPMEGYQTQQVLLLLVEYQVNLCLHL